MWKGLFIVFLAAFVFSACAGESKPTTPIGAVKVFVNATLSEDMATIQKLSEPGAADQVARVSKELKPLIDTSTVLQWQNMNPTSGQHAVSAQIPGKGQMLVVELNKSGEEWRICQIGMVSF